MPINMVVKVRTLLDFFYFLNKKQDGWSVWVDTLWTVMTTRAAAKKLERERAFINLSMQCFQHVCNLVPLICLQKNLGEVEHRRERAQLGTNPFFNICWQLPI